MIQKLRIQARRALCGILVALLITSIPTAISSAAPAATGTAAKPAATATAEQAEDKKKAGGDAGDGVAVAAKPTVGVAASAPAASLSVATEDDAPAEELSVEPAKPDTTETKPEEKTANTEQAAVEATAAEPATPSDDDPDTTVAVQNNTDSQAVSGDATVKNTGDGGNATSGNAGAKATVVTVVGSSTGLGGGTHTAFVRDIYGDVQENLLIDPSTLAPVNGTGVTTLHNPTQSSVSLIDIENNVNLSALSGDASVLDNGDGGDATTGDANALATILNIVSSSIGARNSFLGVINIHGNLQGDIQVPESFVDSLVAGNGNQTAAATTDGGPAPESKSKINIANNVSLSAISGNADVLDNGDGGDATTGNATTDLRVYNLTGQQVIAKNSLLVFVNVMGEWVGMIVPAPAGSTSATLGGGVREASSQIPGGHDSTVNITNNVDVRARSGDATVARNGDGGDATSGNAFAGANILNLVHSSFNLDDWFGALFINVMGRWLGNFDIVGRGGAGSGGVPVQPQTGTTGNPAAEAVRAVKVYQFAGDTSFKPAPRRTSPVQATNDTQGTLQVARTEAAINPTAAVTRQSGEVLGDSDQLPALPQTLGVPDNVSFATMIAGMTLMAILATLAIRRFRATG